MTPNAVVPNTLAVTNSSVAARLISQSLANGEITAEEAANLRAKMFASRLAEVIMENASVVQRHQVAATPPGQQTSLYQMSTVIAPANTSFISLDDLMARKAVLASRISIAAARRQITAREQARLRSDLSDISSYEGAFRTNHSGLLLEAEAIRLFNACDDLDGQIRNLTDHDVPFVD